MFKHFSFLKFKFLQQLQFRLEIVLWIVLDLIPFAVLFLVMKTIYQNAKIVHSYSVQDIVVYYLAVVLIQAFTSTHFEGWRVEEIKNGKIDGYLLRPFSYLKEIIFTDLAGKAFSLIVFLPIYLLFYIIAQSVAAFSLPNITFIQGLLLISFLLFAYFVEMCFGLIIVLLGFWFEGSQGLEHFKWITITLFSGSMIPLEFLPPWLKNITNWLPFRYMYSVPIGLVQGRTILNVSDLGIIAVSVLVLFSLVMILWKKAIYTYTSSGG